MSAKPLKTSPAPRVVRSKPVDRDGSCPVAAIARELAAIYRALDSLKVNSDTCAAALAVTDDGEGPLSVDYATDLLIRRSIVLQQLATVREATSPLGAALHLLLAGHCWTEGMLAQSDWQSLPPAAQRAIAQRDRDVTSMVYSALHVLGVSSDDPDLPVLWGRHGPAGATDVGAIDQLLEMPLRAATSHRFAA